MLTKLLTSFKTEIHHHGSNSSSLLSLVLPAIVYLVNLTQKDSCYSNAFFNITRDKFEGHKAMGYIQEWSMNPLNLFYL